MTKIESQLSEVQVGTDKNIPQKPRRQIWHKLIGILLGLYMGAIWLIVLADAKIVWLPWDVVGSVVGDVQYYTNHPEKSVPQISASDSKLSVSNFVEKRFIPALEIINREPEFKYLVEMVVKYKIPIAMGEPEKFSGWENMALYEYTCPGKPVGKVFINSANTYTDIKLAGHLVHELTHAYNKITKPEYYCAGKKYVSDELSAFKNATLFEYQYNHLAFMDVFTGGQVDLRGNVKNYCLYYKIKNTPIYAVNIDDVKLSPAPGSDESIACHISLLK